jgi:hypothetical protein
MRKTLSQEEEQAEDDEEQQSQDVEVEIHQDDDEDQETGAEVTTEVQEAEVGILFVLKPKQSVRNQIAVHNQVALQFYF